jgi:hypothetical protein
MSDNYPRYFRMDTRAVRRLRGPMFHELLHPDGAWRPLDDYKRFWSEAEAVTEHEFRVLVNDYLGMYDRVHATVADWLKAERKRTGGGACGPNVTSPTG